MRKNSAQLFLRSPRSTDRLVPAVVRERDDQMSGPSGARATPAPTATESGHPWPVGGSHRLRAAGRVTAREMSRQSCPGCSGRWRAAKPRHIIPATHACVGRRATGSIRAVRWRQSRQRRRSASAVKRMRGWVLGCVSTSAGSRRACRPQVSHVATNIHAPSAVTQPYPREHPPGPECARRRSWRHARRAAVRASAKMATTGAYNQ